MVGGASETCGSVVLLARRYPDIGVMPWKPWRSTRGGSGRVRGWGTSRERLLVRASVHLAMKLCRIRLVGRGHYVPLLALPTGGRLRTSSRFGRLTSTARAVGEVTASCSVAPPSRHTLPHSLAPAHRQQHLQAESQNNHLQKDLVAKASIHVHRSYRPYPYIQLTACTRVRAHMPCIHATSQ